MTDIVERLRDTYSAWNNPPSPALPRDAGVVLEAADEIERLRKLPDILAAEIERLRGIPDWKIGEGKPKIIVGSRKLWEAMGKIISEADIVERLRQYVENIRGGEDDPPEGYLCWQAADEIERLRKAWQASIDERDQLQLEIRALKENR